MHRRPGFSSLVVGLLVAAGVASGRIAYLDIATERGVREVDVGDQSPLILRYVIPPAWSSPEEWHLSWWVGLIVGVSAGSVCFAAVSGREPDPERDDD